MKHRYLEQVDESQSTPVPPRYICSACNRPLDWAKIKAGLREKPRCLSCWRPLVWRYAAETVCCSTCNESWTYREYRKKLRNRSRLPCSRCGQVVTRTQGSTGDAEQPSTRRKSIYDFMELKCPRCNEEGVHERGVFKCPNCGHEKEWSRFRRQLKRRSERLTCRGCGASFTWEWWRRKYRSGTGNAEYAVKFVQEWRRCVTDADRLLAIDTLMHAMHGRGLAAEAFIDTDRRRATALLDELAQG